MPIKACLFIYRLWDLILANLSKVEGDAVRLLWRSQERVYLLVPIFHLLLILWLWVWWFLIFVSWTAINLFGLAADDLWWSLQVTRLPSCDFFYAWNSNKTVICVLARFRPCRDFACCWFKEIRGKCQNVAVASTVLADSIRYQCRALTIFHYPQIFLKDSCFDWLQLSQGASSFWIS